jgi:hypothetical protein
MPWILDLECIVGSRKIARKGVGENAGSREQRMEIGHGE